MQNATIWKSPQTTQPTSGGTVTADTNCCANCVETFRPRIGGPSYRFYGRSGHAGWLALLLIKAADVETNPGPTTSHKRVWICDICYTQIHVRKQISIRCNRFEHWLHLRYPPSTIHRYLDLPSTQRIQTHISHRHNTTPPLQTLVQAPYPLPTCTTHTIATQTQKHVQHSPCSDRNGKNPNPILSSTHPLSIHAAPSQTHTHLTHFTNSSHP